MLERKQHLQRRFPSRERAPISITGARSADRARPSRAPELPRRSPCSRPWCPRARAPARCVSVVSTPKITGTPSSSAALATPLRYLARDVIEMRRGSANHAPSAITASNFSLLASRAATSGTSHAPGTRDQQSPAHLDAVAPSASNAPSTRSLDNETLKREATIAKRALRHQERAFEDSELRGFGRVPGPRSTHCSSHASGNAARTSSMP